MLALQLPWELRVRVMTGRTGLLLSCAPQSLVQMLITPHGLPPVPGHRSLYGRPGSSGKTRPRASFNGPLCQPDTLPRLNPCSPSSCSKTIFTSDPGLFASFFNLLLGDPSVPSAYKHAQVLPTQKPLPRSLIPLNSPRHDSSHSRSHVLTPTHSSRQYDLAFYLL